MEKALLRDSRAETVAKGRAIICRVSWDSILDSPHHENQSTMQVTPILTHLIFAPS